MGKVGRYSLLISSILFSFFLLLLTRICECGHRRILYNQWKEEKEKKKARCCRRRRVDALVGGGYDRILSNGGGLLRLQATIHKRRKKRE